MAHCTSLALLLAGRPIDRLACRNQGLICPYSSTIQINHQHIGQLLWKMAKLTSLASPLLCLYMRFSFALFQWKSRWLVREVQNSSRRCGQQPERSFGSAFPRRRRIVEDYWSVLYMLDQLTDFKTFLLYASKQCFACTSCFGRSESLIKCTMYYNYVHSCTLHDFTIYTRSITFNFIFTN
jgi:hypothetical protein